MSNRIVPMANQIAAFFATQPGGDQAARVAAHLNDFWAPAMRAELAEHMAAAPQDFAPLVQAARAHLILPEA
ncbi:formate dehydrogenase subunit delta [Paracoccus sp. p4-l81]|uniref:formate dehydrogenase subunit delta n=1 Tax=Paracoccus sp. p4-l81 TaxID=3342806 RepID=UPI0035B8C47A